MQHRVSGFLEADDARERRLSVRASDPRAAELWNNGGSMSCVGRWAVVWAMPGSFGNGWAVFPSVAVARFTSKQRADGYAAHRRSQAFDGDSPPFRARVIRWRRDLDRRAGDLLGVPRVARALRFQLD